MRIDIVAAIPDLMRSPLEHSIMMRARDKELLEVHLHDLRTYGIGKARQIDDYPYGGGGGRPDGHPAGLQSRGPPGCRRRPRDVTDHVAAGHRDVLRLAGR